MSNYQFHGCDAVALAHEYGTPLYVMSEDEIVKKIRAVKALFDDRYERCLTHYASKAFFTRDMLRIVKREGVGLDIVSGGELYLAREMDFDPRLVTFHGNSKTEAEIAAGLDYGVGEFVCDSAEEIVTINRIAAGQNKERAAAANVLIRISPETESRTHAHIATAGRGSKFGIPSVVLEEAVDLCSRLPHIRLRGFHFHVGSQLMDNRSHLEALEAVLALIRRIHASRGYAPETLDMGGGFGVAYTEDDAPEPIGHFIGPLVERTEKFFRGAGMKRPRLVIEPGRFIVAEAGVTLYTVGSVKAIPGGRTWVGVDGGYPDNPRPELYGARYRATLANREGEPADRVVTVVGKCCESGDVLIEDIALPEPARGDTLAVFTTGAYNLTMASNYNKNPIPALVMIRDGQPRLSVRRQTYEQMFANDL